MTSVRLGRWLTVREIIGLFVAMGCEERVSRATLTDYRGSLNPRYLYSPETTDYVVLDDLEDDDLLSELEIANWERRLGMEIPKGHEH